VPAFRPPETPCLLTQRNHSLRYRSLVGICRGVRPKPTVFHHAGRDINHYSDGYTMLSPSLYQVASSLTFIDLTDIYSVLNGLYIARHTLPVLCSRRARSLSEPLPKARDWSTRRLIIVFQLAQLVQCFSTDLPFFTNSTYLATGCTELWLRTQPYHKFSCAVKLQSLQFFIHILSSPFISSFSIHLQYEHRTEKLSRMS